MDNYTFCGRVDLDGFGGYFQIWLAEDLLDMVIVIQMELDSSLDFVEQRAGKRNRKRKYYVDIRLSANCAYSL